MNLTDVLVAITRDLRELDRSFALVGGLAVSARTEPRFTRDVDLAIVVSDDEDAEALVRALIARDWRLIETVEHDELSRLAGVRLQTGGESAPVVDLLLASSGAEDHVVGEAEELELVDGQLVSVAGTAHLLALKLLSRGAARPQDDVDVRALAAAMRGDDWRRAADLAQLITDRGGNRDRDLVAEISRLRSNG